MNSEFLFIRILEKVFGSYADRIIDRIAMPHGLKIRSGGIEWSVDEGGQDVSRVVVHVGNWARSDFFVYAARIKYVAWSGYSGLREKRAWLGRPLDLEFSRHSDELPVQIVHGDRASFFVDGVTLATDLSNTGLKRTLLMVEIEYGLGRFRRRYFTVSNVEQYVSYLTERPAISRIWSRERAC